MRTMLRGAVVLTLIWTGCTQSPTTNGGRLASNSAAHPDPNQTRRMITGSNIPQPVDRVTPGVTSATQPLDSFARDRPGLTPTEPVVGASGQSDYRLKEPGTGAGPAGSNPLPSSN